MTQQPLGSEELVFCQPFTIRRPKLKEFSTGGENLAQMSHWVCSLTMSQYGMAFSIRLPAMLNEEGLSCTTLLTK
jgi:hypothetical protein